MKKEFKTGDSIPLSDKESGLMEYFESSLRGTLKEFVASHQAEFLKINGGAHNAILTVVGKMYADLIGFTAVITNSDIVPIKKELIRLLEQQIDEDYFEHLEKVKNNDSPH